MIKTLLTTALIAVPFAASAADYKHRGALYSQDPDFPNQYWLVDVDGKAHGRYVVLCSQKAVVYANGTHEHVNLLQNTLPNGNIRGLYKHHCKP